MAQPGTSWIYGANFELLSRAVERISGAPSLGAYMKELIFDPLGITQATFHLASRPDMQDQIMDMSTRDVDGKVVPSALENWWKDRTFDSGGGGLYITPGEYARVLRAILRNDGILLKPATMELLFEPQLGPKVQQTFESSLYDNGGVPVLSAGLPRSARTTQALGGTVCREYVYGDVDGGDGKRRNKGSLNWGGLPNMLWMVDREMGLGMVWDTQLMPTGDLRVLGGWRRAEEGRGGGVCLYSRKGTRRIRINYVVV
jgi:CubicO group peptidase (beta-lactamase class C family)